MAKSKTPKTPATVTTPTQTTPQEPVAAPTPTPAQPVVQTPAAPVTPAVEPVAAQPQPVAAPVTPAVEPVAAQPQPVAAQPVVQTPAAPVAAPVTPAQPETPKTKVAGVKVPEFKSEIKAVTAEHEAVEKHHGEGLKHATKAGQILQGIRDQLKKIPKPHRPVWDMWVHKNLPFSPASARWYLRLYKGRDTIAAKIAERKAQGNEAKPVSMRGAIGLLAKPKKQPDADARVWTGKITLSEAEFHKVSGEVHVKLSWSKFAALMDKLGIDLNDHRKELAKRKADKQRVAESLAALDAEDAKAQAAIDALDAADPDGAAERAAERAEDAAENNEVPELEDELAATAERLRDVANKQKAAKERREAAKAETPAGVVGAGVDWSHEGM